MNKNATFKQFNTYSMCELLCHQSYNKICIYLAEGKKLNIMTWKGIFHCLIASYPAGGSFLLQKLMVKHSWGGPFTARHWQPGQFSQYIRHIRPSERIRGRQGVRYTGKKNINVRSLSVSCFIEKEPHKQLRMKRKSDERRKRHCTKYTGLRPR